jgi:hypothetical protein
MISRALVAAGLGLTLGPASLHAQRWTNIGPTASGNMVSVDPRSVHRTGHLVAATVRIIFTTPVATPQGAWKSSQTRATFDCAKRSLAAKENTYYADVIGRKVVERKVNKLPGYGPALTGSLGEIALTYLCRKQ